MNPTRPPDTERARASDDRRPSDSRWWELVAEAPAALAFQTPAWRDAVVEGGFSDVSRLYDLDGGACVIPLMARRRMMVPTAASLPYGWGFGGPVGRPPSVAEAARILRDLATLRYARVSLRPDPPAAGVFAAAADPGVVRIPRRAHILDLAGGFDAVWTRRFRSTTRTSVRKAERAGLDIVMDTTGALIPDYYALYERSLLRWGGLPGEPASVARWRGMRRDPQAKFEAVARHLGSGFQLWLASAGGRPVAGIVVLVQDGTASYWRGAMDETLAGPSRANDLLHRHAIEAACQAGRTRYHMGETGDSGSLARFKSGFGAEPHDYVELRIEHLPMSTAEAAIRRSVRTVASTAQRAGRRTGRAADGG